MMNITGVVWLKGGKENSVDRFHVWIFSGAIAKVEGAVNDGDWVRVVSSKNVTLAFGHFQQGSISVRILLFGQEPPGEDFYSTRFASAYKKRVVTGLPNIHTNAFRLIHAEGDGLPGLVVDYYAGTLVVQTHSAGMEQDRHAISDGLKSLEDLSISTIYWADHSQKENRSAYLLGNPDSPKIISEYGNRFYVDWEEGQKTGFFLDQRENRQTLTRYVRGKSVLNTFAYTGGFSVYAIGAGAEKVHTVDASQPAIEMARKNITLNGFDADHHTCYTDDAFTFLSSHASMYDVIVLDPPAFAKRRSAKHQAVKGYQRLNGLAIRNIRPGGIIFTFSCSQVIDKQLFFDTIVSAGLQSRRRISVLERLGQPADHPVSLFHPEGEYLKGLILYVE